MPKEFNKNRDAGRPSKGKSQGNKRSFGNDRPAKGSFSKGNDQRSKPSSDRPVRKSYADNNAFDKESKDSTSSSWKKDASKPSYPRGDKQEGKFSKPWSKDKSKDSDSREYKPRTFNKDSDSREFKPRSSSKQGDSREFKPRAFNKDSDSREFKPRTFNKDSDSREFKPRASSKEGDSREFKPRAFNKDSDSREFKPRTSSKDGESREYKPRTFNKDSDSREFKPRTSSKDGESREYKPRTFNKDSDSRDFKPRASSKDGDSGDYKQKSFNKDSDSREFKPRTFSKEGDRKFSDNKRPIKRYENKGSKYSPENFAASNEGEPIGKPRRTRVSSKPKQSEEGDLQFGTVRLNKYIANAGICSRREADVLIETGSITVNGKIVSELGYKVGPTDIVAYGGQGIRKERNVYILLNKPKDYITTADDPMERKTVMHLIKGACKERVYPVGRLDRNSTGLLILTNDGELTKKLTHPRYEKKKIYHIELDRPLAKADMEQILEGVELEDGMVHVDEISYVTGAETKREVGIELHSGKNRVIRRIFEHLGYDVKKLDRVYFAGLSKKDLPRGRWRFLTEREVAMLNSK